jgi:hypothetical protein
MHGVCSIHVEIKRRTQFYSENLNFGANLGDLGLDGMTIVKCILRKMVGSCGLGLSDPAAGVRENGNETSGSTKSEYS